MDYETFGTRIYTATAGTVNNNYAPYVIDCSDTSDNYFTYTNYQDEHIKECVREEVSHLMKYYCKRICETIKEYAKMDIPEEEFLNILMGE